MVGCGGGPGTLFFPSRGLEAAGLQEGAGDHRHQGVSVKAGPGPALEVVEAKLVLELLMRLFATPSGLDGSGERLEAGVGWQVRGVVFPLAGRTTLTDQPDLLISRHGLHATVGHTVFVAIGDPDAGCCEPAAQPAFGAPPPAELPSFFTFQHLFGGNGRAIWQVIFAAAPTPGLGKDQSDIDRMDVLAPRRPTAQARPRVLSAWRKGPLDP